MNRLTTAERARVVATLVEGNSIRATVRMTGIAKNTIAKLLLDLGGACSKYLDVHLRNLPCKRIQVDEIWSFVYAKQKNVSLEVGRERIAGDVWTWVGIDAETKLVVSWMLGGRGAGYARRFMDDLASRLANRVQLTTDGHRSYLDTVPKAFARDVDYAVLQKIYGPDPSGERRYSPAACIGTHTEVKIGIPDPKHISTSFVERQNLTMRMQMRRFTRLTNALSKKIESHAAAIALHYMHYNFCRIHQTLRITPAMAAGISDHVWDIHELVELLP